jgi:hypothetical protein
MLQLASFGTLLTAFVSVSSTPNARRQLMELTTSSMPTHAAADANKRIHLLLLTKAVNAASCNPIAAVQMLTAAMEKTIVTIYDKACLEKTDRKLSVNFDALFNESSTKIGFS